MGSSGLGRSHGCSGRRVKLGTNLSRKIAEARCGLPSGTKLVLLPGLDGTGVLFADFVGALPKEWQTATVRYPLGRCLSYSELEGLVRAACSISEPFMLLAESFSTSLAIKYAASNPVNLEGLVLCAGFATSPVRTWRRFLGSLLAPLMFHVPLPNLAAKHWLVGPDAPASLLALGTVRDLRGATESAGRTASDRAEMRCPCGTGPTTVSSAHQVSKNFGGSNRR
jgi:pimeloyl-ACP methyl ester carboxylesterase